MIEQKLKTLIGEYTFQICVLQHQLEEAQKEIASLKKEKDDGQSNS